MVMVCCQRGRRGDVWEKGWEKEGDVQSQCTIGHTSLCVCIGIFVKNWYFRQNNIQTDTIMENNYYETPQLEVLEIAVEQGFATSTSTVDYEEGWDL